MRQLSSLLFSYRRSSRTTSAVDLLALPDLSFTSLNVMSPEERARGLDHRVLQRQRHLLQLLLLNGSMHRPSDWLLHRLLLDELSGVACPAGDDLGGWALLCGYLRWPLLRGRPWALALLSLRDLGAPSERLRVRMGHLVGTGARHVRCKASHQVSCLDHTAHRTAGCHRGWSRAQTEVCSGILGSKPGSFGVVHPLPDTVRPVPG